MLSRRHFLKFYFQSFGFCPWLTACRLGTEEESKMTATLAIQFFVLWWISDLATARNKTALLARRKWWSVSPFQCCHQTVSWFWNKTTQSHDLKGEGCFQDHCYESGNCWANTDSTVPAGRVWRTAVCSRMPGGPCFPTSHHARLPQVSLTTNVKAQFFPTCQTAFCKFSNSWQSPPSRSSMRVVRLGLPYLSLKLLIL